METKKLKLSVFVTAVVLYIENFKESSKKFRAYK